MPINPQYQADLAESGNQNVPTENVGQAAMVGDNIQKLGSALDTFGARVKAQQDATERTLREINVNKLQTRAKDAAETVKNDTLMHGSPDGQDWETRSLKLYDKQMNKDLGKYSDPLGNLMAQQEVAKVRAELRQDVLGYQRKQVVAYANTAVEEAGNGAANRVSLNPYNYDKELGDYSKLVINSAMLPQNKIENIQNAKKQLATSAINGLSNAGSESGFNEAQRMLKTKFSGVFNQEDQQKMFAAIQAKKEKYIENSLKSEDNQDRIAQDMHERVQSKTLTNQLKAAKQILSSPLESQNVGAFEESLDSDVLLGRLSPNMAQLLRTTISGEPGSTHAETAAEFYSRLGSHSGLDQLRKDVVTAQNGGFLSVDTATDILEQADLFSKQGAITAKEQRFRADPRFTEASQRIDAAAKKDLMGNFATQEDADKIFAAKKELAAAWTSGKFKKNSEAFMANLLKKHFDYESALSIPLDTAPEVIQKRKQDYGIKKASATQAEKEAYLNWLKAITSAKANTNNLKQRKDGTRGK